MTVPAPLDPVYQVIYACVDGMSHSHALAILRAKGYTPDAEQLADAVESLRLRDLFLVRGDADPYLFLDVAPAATSRPGVSVWDAAVERAEDDLTFSLKQLSKRPAALALIEAAGGH